MTDKARLTVTAAAISILASVAGLSVHDHTVTGRIFTGVACVGLGLAGAKIVRLYRRIQNR